jgi:hypothetical protein
MISIAGILLVLWAAALLMNRTWGGIIHILPIAAALLIVFNLYSARKRASAMGSDEPQR